MTNLIKTNTTYEIWSFEDEFDDEGAFIDGSIWTLEIAQGLFDSLIKDSGRIYRILEVYSEYREVAYAQ